LGGAKQLAKTLVYGTWTHDYPLMVRKLRELGLPVKTEMLPEVYRLMELYPQAQPIKPSVEYIPSPYYSPQLPQRRATERLSQATHKPAYLSWDLNPSSRGP